MSSPFFSPRPTHHHIISIDSISTTTILVQITVTFCLKCCSSLLTHLLPSTLTLFKFILCTAASDLYNVNQSHGQELSMALGKKFKMFSVAGGAVQVGSCLVLQPHVTPLSPSLTAFQELRHFFRYLTQAHSSLRVLYCLSSVLCSNDTSLKR